MVHLHTERGGGTPNFLEHPGIPAVAETRCPIGQVAIRDQSSQKNDLLIWQLQRLVPARERPRDGDALSDFEVTKLPPAVERQEWVVRGQLDRPAELRPDPEDLLHSTAHEGRD